MTRLTLTSQDLGIYLYDIRLNALPAPPERSIHFKVGLGGSQTQMFRFNSFAKVKMEYSCRIDSPDFLVEKSVVVSPSLSGGTETCIEITYEPSHLGDVKTQLLVSSVTGGEFICPLFGHCIAPRPQGPIIIKTGSATILPFKNVFSTSSTFNCVVDNPCFTVKSSETIPPKKSIQFSIGFKPPGSTDEKKGSSAAAFNPANLTAAQKVGKLNISTPNSPVVWVYYLKLVV